MTDRADEASLVTRVLGRLGGVRSWASSPARRTVLYAAAVTVFVVSTVAAWGALPEERAPVDPALIVLAALLVLPGALVNAEEYRVSARIVGQQVAMPAALRVAVVAAAFNLLPVPGSVLVRTNALTRGGSTTGDAVRSTAAVGIAYIGVALVAVGVVQAPGDAVSGVVLGAVGLAGLAVAGLMVRRMTGAGARSHMARLVGVEAVSVLIKALRLFLVVRAVGFDPDAVQAVSLSMATVAASAIGIFPGGLGIREVLAGFISPAVGLPASVGLLGTSVDRIVGLATLSVLAAVVLAVTRAPEEG